MPKPSGASKKERKKVQREVAKMQKTAAGLMTKFLKSHKYSGFRRVGFDSSWLDRTIWGPIAASIPMDRASGGFKTRRSQRTCSQDPCGVCLDNFRPNQKTFSKKAG